MAIEIKTQNLFPVRRDKQIASSITYGTGSGGGGGVIDASIDLSNYALISYVDSSLIARDLNISYLESSINNSYDAAMFFIPEASFNDSYFKWVSGYLEPSIAGGGTGDVTKVYVDGSLAARDARIAAINASLGDEDNILSYVNSSTYYDGSLNARVLKSGDTMTGDLFINGGSFRVSNARGFEGTNTSGITRRIFQLYNDNNVYMDAADGDFIMRTKSGGSVVEIARFKGTTQFLGVGTNNPTVRLAVSGDASISGTLYGASNKAEKNTTISYKTTAYTLTGADNNCVIEASGTFGIYLPTNLLTGFQALIMNVGGGTITINASTGATVYTRDSSNDLTKRWTGATVYKRDSTSWAAMGDLQ